MNNMMNYDFYKFNYFPFYNKHGWELDIKLVDSQMKSRVKRKEDCSNPELQQQFRKIMKTTMSTYKILYTHGFKNKDGTAYAFCNENGDEGIKVKILNKEVSIFVAEAAAIRDCLLYIELNFTPGKFCLVSDSLAVVSAVEAKSNTYKRHRIIGIILDIIERLIILNYDIKIM